MVEYGLMLPLKMDKTALSIVPLEAEGDDVIYWRSRTPNERLEALEFLRQASFGYDPATARLQRVLEVVELKRD